MTYALTLLPGQFVSLVKNEKELDRAVAASVSAAASAQKKGAAAKAHGAHVVFFVEKNKKGPPDV